MGNTSSGNKVATKSSAAEESRNRSSSTASQSSNGEQRRRASSSAINPHDPRRSSSSAINPASFYITPEEQEHTRTLYDLLWPKGKDYMNEEFFSTLFTTYQVAPFLIKTLRVIFITGKFKNSYESFEEFLMQCSRTSTSATLLILWKMTKYMALNEEAFDWSSRLTRFCALLLLFSTQKEPQSERELFDSASDLAEFYAQIVHRGDATIDCNTDFNTLLPSVLLYSPQAARPMQVLMSTIFFQADLSPSFHPYQPPQCSTESLLLSNFAAGFLAMSGETLQGAWKCLYTMTKDGISFNRIVHHVLGYDVRTFTLYMFKYILLFRFMLLIGDCDSLIFRVQQ